MKIEVELCNGCGNCVIICPVQAIKLIDNKAVINKDKCVECAVCKLYADCPVQAIKSTRLKWPRIIRSPFSNVIAPHKITGIPGRGTEEMKTNDVTNRFSVDEIGVSIDVGRPGVGTYLRDIELFTVKLSKLGVVYEKDSPVTVLMVDKQGHIKEELKNERVLSALIEFKIPNIKLNEILQIIREVEKEIDTVFTVGIIARAKEDGFVPLIELLKEKGFEVQPNAKINVGLGKP
ncbi:MAG: indolepyruvate ferredoxin oxidoreductase subunit alpha [Promethearchaeota archaeon]